MALVGSYSIDITPEHSVDLNGYILRFGKSEGVHDPLTANFIFIEDKNKKSLLISLDILTIGSDIAEDLIEKISEILQMEKEAIIIAAIHTHSAIGRPYLRNVGEESREWQEDFRKKMIQGSRIAYENRIESDLYAFEAFSSVAINRRNPERGFDPYAPFIIVKNGLKTIAWMINYNCHAVCLRESNLKISADYIYYLRQSIYNKLGEKFPILFFNGGSGDVDPKKRGSFEEAKFTGEKLAQELLLSYQAYEGIKINTDIEFGSIIMNVPYSWQPSIEEAKENLEIHTKKYDESQTKEQKKINGAFVKWAADVLQLVEKKSLPKSIDIKISIIKIGRVMFIAVPLEIFSSISLKLRKIFGDKILFVISYGNGYNGYLADKAAYFEGGYEIEDWHKYAGILPKVPNIEDIFWESIKIITTKKEKY